ncbi:MAG: deoxyribodipyrimidine photo-lyase [Verrucomicrobia bacterium]|nr:deoxyribodipyrimidine photo-lyase [Verrucomicrobiota bacterium]
MVDESLLAPTLVCFRQDLRLSDNPALAAAVDRGGPVIPVFIWSPEEDGVWRPGAASEWWLNRSLAALSAEIEKRGSRLIIRRGPTRAAVHDLLAETGASAVFWNRRYEPAAVARDRDFKAELRERGLSVASFNGSLLFEPWAIRNGSGQPFRVFTPFWRTCLTNAPALPSKDASGRLRAPETWPCSLKLPELGLEPSINWAGGLGAMWQPGEAGAKIQLQRFREEAIQDYPVGRDKPDVIGTSRLSPHLHFGEISPGQVWRAVQNLMSQGIAGNRAACEAYLRQLGWREFAHQLLYHHPESPEQALRPEFATFPWKTDPRTLRTWTRGKTGYPLVDAGMRELWHTGWMHNRVRMVVASFLVKHLLIGWQEGAAWFWDTLVDADLANNTLGWQWVAGCGADAAPYFRIFNPVIQGEKFDPSGAYVRRWVPELAGMPDEWIHKPWKAPATILSKAGVEFGKTYPAPIVDHDAARKRALAALQTIRR